MRVSQFIHRACVACDNIYFGPINCTDCGEPGEPMLFFGILPVPPANDREPVDDD